MICTGMCRVSGFCLSWAQNGPSQHVGKENVERDGGGLELLGKVECVDAAHRDKHLEAAVARKIHDDTRIGRIILDDQQDAVPGHDFEPIVRNVLDRTIGRGLMVLLFSTRACSASADGGAGRAGIVGPT